MKLIVGLGNYGAEYAATRHNVGFMTVEHIAAQLGVEFSREKHFARVAECRVGGEKVMLMQPQTYMNKSGLAVADAVSFYHLEPEDVLVIFDDMDLRCGQVKIRKKGSGGGHKGIGDIIRVLSTDQIARIKIGIDHPVYDKVVDYVLKPFGESERELIRPAIELAAEAALYWLENGVVETMNIYNGYGKEGAQKPKSSAEPKPPQAQQTAVKAAKVQPSSARPAGSSQGQQTAAEDEAADSFAAKLRRFLQGGR